MKRSIAIAISALMCIGITMGSASPAYAIGNNRDVSRDCGVNHVSSGRIGNKYWVQTERRGGLHNGKCKGRLSVAFELENGYQTPRVPGTADSAYTTYTATQVPVKYGLHWGCDNCAVTRS